MNNFRRRNAAASNLFAALIVLGCMPSINAAAIYISGDLRLDANVISCGPLCALGSGNSNGDYAQWAAVVTPFTVTTPGAVQAITYSFGGGTSLTGAPVASGGLEPYLSLFDSGGNFLASTYLGTLCPPGAGSFNGNCFDVELDAGPLAAGTYFIALTAYLNQSVAENPGGATLADGFTGLGGLGSGEDLHYGFDLVLSTAVDNTPEPLTGMFVLAGIAAICAKKRLLNFQSMKNKENTDL